MLSTKTKSLEILYTLFSMQITTKIQQALDVAAQCHRHHRRIGFNVPYIVHPVSVAIIVSAYTNDEDTICAALLHDIIEDSDEYDVKSMSKDFGERVTSLVQALTEQKNSSDSLEILRQNWEFRKRQYLEGLKQAPQEALVICAADTIHNLRSLARLRQDHGDKFFGCFGASLDRKMGFYDKLVAHLQTSLNSPIVAELTSTFEDTRKVLI